MSFSTDSSHVILGFPLLTFSTIFYFHILPVEHSTSIRSRWPNHFTRYTLRCSSISLTSFHAPQNLCAILSKSVLSDIIQMIVIPSFVFASYQPRLPNIETHDTLLSSHMLYSVCLSILLKDILPQTVPDNSLNFLYPAHILDVTALSVPSYFERMSPR